MRSWVDFINETAQALKFNDPILKPDPDFKQELTIRQANPKTPHLLIVRSGFKLNEQGKVTRNGCINLELYADQKPLLLLGLFAPIRYNNSTLVADLWLRVGHALRIHKYAPVCWCGGVTGLYQSKYKVWWRCVSHPKDAPKNGFVKAIDALDYRGFVMKYHRSALQWD